MSEKKLEMIRLAGERLSDEQDQFQLFVDEMLDQMEIRRTAIDAKTVLIHEARLHRAENQRNMDAALVEIHGHSITARQQEYMAGLSGELSESQRIIETLEVERRQLQVDMDQAVEELTAFAAILTMVDEIKADFERAQSEWGQTCSRVSNGNSLESNAAHDRLLGQLKKSQDEVDRLTLVVEQHSLQLASERDTAKSRIKLLRRSA